MRIIALSVDVQLYHSSMTPSYTYDISSARLSEPHIINITHICLTVRIFSHIYTWGSSRIICMVLFCVRWRRKLVIASLFSWRNIYMSWSIGCVLHKVSLRLKIINWSKAAINLAFIAQSQICNEQSLIFACKLVRFWSFLY